MTVLGAAPEGSGKSHDGDGWWKMALEGAVFVGNKIENDFCDLIFISHVVWQVLPERSTMVLPLDEVSKYFISVKNRI